MDDRQPEAEARMRRRLRRRISIGLIVGASIGVLGGLILSLILPDVGSRARVMILVAAAIFAGGIGALIGGYASLESPDPGDEPSDTERPIADRPDLTREEHPSTEVGRRPDHGAG